jgi:hypothetical protein
MVVAEGGGESHARPSRRLNDTSHDIGIMGRFLVLDFFVSNV